MLSSHKFGTIKEMGKALYKFFIILVLVVSILPNTLEHSLCITHLKTHHGFSFSEKLAASDSCCHHIGENNSDELSINECQHHQHDRCDILVFQKAEITRAAKTSHPNCRALFKLEADKNRPIIKTNSILSEDFFAPPDLSIQLISSIQLII